MCTNRRSCADRSTYEFAFSAIYIAICLSSENHQDDRTNCDRLPEHATRRKSALANPPNVRYFLLLLLSLHFVIVVFCVQRHLFASSNVAYYHSSSILRWSIVVSHRSIDRSHTHTHTHTHRPARSIRRRRTHLPTRVRHSSTIDEQPTIRQLRSALFNVR
jgi:hypothetical protein